MGNRANDEGTDIAIYRRPQTDTVHADTPTGAPEQLLALIDHLGFERNIVRPIGDEGPAYIWHEAPGHLSKDETKRLATRAVPSLLTAGYTVHLPGYLFDQDVYHRAVEDLRAQRITAAAASPAAARPPRRPRG